MIPAFNCVEVNSVVAHLDVTNEPTVRFAIAYLYGHLFALGLVLNLGVIASIARHRALLRSGRNLLLLNLNAAALLLCFTSIPFTPFSVIQKRWSFGALLCRTVPFAQSVAVVTTSWTLVAIALDKYAHIVLVGHGPMRPRLATTILGSIWITSMVVNVPYLLSNNLLSGDYWKKMGRAADVYCGEYCYESGWRTGLQQKLYGTSVTVLQFVVPTVVITYCYAKILCKVHNDMILANAQFVGSLTWPQRLMAIRRRRRVNYILISMVVAFIVAWLPLTTLNVGRDYHFLPADVIRKPWIYSLVVHSVAMTTVIWNPIICFWLTKRSEKRRSSSAYSATFAAESRRVSQARNINELAHLLTSQPVSTTEVSTPLRKVSFEVSCLGRDSCGHRDLSRSASSHQASFSSTRTLATEAGYTWRVSGRKYGLASTCTSKRRRPTSSSGLSTHKLSAENGCLPRVSRRKNLPLGTVASHRQPVIHSSLPASVQNLEESAACSSVPCSHNGVAHHAASHQASSSDLPVYLHEKRLEQTLSTLSIPSPAVRYAGSSPSKSVTVSMMQRSSDAERVSRRDSPIPVVMIEAVPDQCPPVLYVTWGASARC